MKDKTCKSHLTEIKNHIKAELKEAFNLFDYDIEGSSQQFVLGIKIFIFIRTKLKELDEYIDFQKIEYLKLEEKETQKP